MLSSVKREDWVVFNPPLSAKWAGMEHQSFEKFSVTLPREMARVIHERVDSGDYGSVSEVIRDAMRAWLQRERRLAVLDAALARGIAELDATQGQDAEQVRKELRVQLAAKVSPDA